ncbi:o-succinylbenzoate--CoA ligase [Oryzobacter telluris]|uniref:o-succinylbenzoate--CoA ligase n=1 Tax=Oryzobacter telluris TaxID=3149179 RepID=UPI00370CFDC2
MTGRPVPRGDLVLEQLPVPAGEAALALLPRLEQALAGGAPVAPYAASSPAPLLPPHGPADLPDDLAVVVGTSGSTGTPKHALLTTGALRASAQGTHERLGGPGQWLLPLPAHHVAGLQVLLRSVEAGTIPVAMDLTDGFTPRAFADAAARLEPGVRHHTSLVPTQLLRLLDDPDGAEALRSLDAVLVGGAALAPHLRRRAADSGVTVVATYGMSETAGGCVYDGRPLPCTEVALDDTGRISLGGATLAHGYLGRPDLTGAAFTTDEHGTRWFRTDDVGHTDADGRLHVDGRVDDLVNTGGLKVAPRLVEEAVVEHVPGVREVVVVGTPHPQWGEAVSVLLVMRPGAVRRGPTAADLRAHLRGVLPDHALPVRVLVVDEVPLAGPGKPDRRAVAALFTVGG